MEKNELALQAEQQLNHIINKDTLNNLNTVNDFYNSNILNKIQIFVNGGHEGRLRPVLRNS